MMTAAVELQSVYPLVYTHSNASYLHIRLFTETFPLATFITGYFSDNLAYKGPPSTEESARKRTGKHITAGRG